ncbi:MAG: hypothetical protein DME19_10125 [Verrucomicrobia bacterium]|nr:MAG: hypothetical protein DME19_10125 [Verrucomicrobiota bacterium]
MYFTMFRNVWGGCLGGCSIRYLFSRRGRATFLLVTTLLFAGIAVNWGSITRTALYQGRISNVANIYDRLGAWLYAFRAFSEHPLTGLGPDRIKQYIKKAQEAGDDLRVMDVPATWHPHNTIIAQLAENGLLVVVPLCLMIWYFIGEVRACIRLARSPADVEFGLYAVAVAFAILAPGLTDRAYEWAKLNNLMYVVFALVAAHGVKLRKLARLELAERPRHVVLKELAAPAHQTGSTKSAGVRPAFLNPLLVRAEGHQPEPALSPRDRSSR